MATPGYSGTPLAKKLGFKEGFRAALVNAPSKFSDELIDLPTGVEFVAPARQPLDLALLFVEGQGELLKSFAKLAARLAPAGALWIAWRKKSSGAQTDLDENVVRETGLESGLVDTKVCAINETWSGLRFVRRLRDRTSQTTNGAEKMRRMLLALIALASFCSALRAQASTSTRTTTTSSSRAKATRSPRSVPGETAKKIK
jgi:hypothetical protein